MKIHDTAEYFLNSFEPSIDFLRSYYEKYPDIFADYFASHCKDTDERHNESIRKYPPYFTAIKQVYENILPIIDEIANEYWKLYQISFPVDINLIIGGFGSNAYYTYRQTIPNITFALEKLSPNPDHLRVIVAHEFGHLAQNILSDQAGIDWTKIQWNSPLIGIYQEGAATHLSRQTVLGLQPSIYYSYNEEGYDWLDFANENKREIKKAFGDDYLTQLPGELFREWFSINGGKRFGYNRLAYYLGNMFCQYQIEKIGEKAALVAWRNENFEEQVKQWLFKGSK